MKTMLHRNRGFTLLELLVVISIIASLTALAIPAIGKVQTAGHMATATSNAKNIVVALKTYAADHHGLYPDSDRAAAPETSNDAFRLLFKAGAIKDERIFGSSVSQYRPDGDFGSAPDYEKALEAGENHWALTAGLSDATDGPVPVVFENPVSTSWPPMWNAKAAGTAVEGRSWSGGRIIVARNDGSCGSEALESADGDNVPLKPNGSGKDLFTQFTEQGRFLDIQR
jgi:prepilin-type N-terminal cleavage/methylation domain-containing protein